MLHFKYLLTGIPYVALQLQFGKYISLYLKHVLKYEPGTEYADLKRKSPKSI